MVSKHRIVAAIASLLLCTGSLVACSNQPVATPALVLGNWVMLTSDNYEVTVIVSELRQGEYYFDAGKHPISGIYAIDGGNVLMVKPDNPRMGDMAWGRNSPRSLTLIREPAVELSGQRLIASTMTKSP